MSLSIENITEALAGRTGEQRFRPSPAFQGHEEVVHVADPDIGLKAFIAVHSTQRGPALGGCRYWSRYRDESEAIDDVLRLSEGMTYKNSAADLPLGGGKTVIMGPAGTRQPTPAMLRAIGQAVQFLDGRYVTAEDVGTDVNHMLLIKGQTDYVCGLPLASLYGEHLPADIKTHEIPAADPSPYTAFGTFQAIKAAVKYELDLDTLRGLTLTVKGYGHVAQLLCRHLTEEGARLVIADIDDRRRAQIVSDYGLEALLPPDKDIMTASADIYVPCALGGDIDEGSIGSLTRAGVKIVAGCANNQLKLPRHAESLRKAGILYAPDFVANAGGVIAAGIQYLWMSNPHPSTFPRHGKVMERAGRIHHTLLEIFRKADEKQEDTATIAGLIAHEGLRAAEGRRAA